MIRNSQQPEKPNSKAYPRGGGGRRLATHRRKVVIVRLHGWGALLAVFHTGEKWAREVVVPLKLLEVLGSKSACGQLRTWQPHTCIQSLPDSRINRKRVYI
jgi:hypothetical protein